MTRYALLASILAVHHARMVFIVADCDRACRIVDQRAEQSLWIYAVAVMVFLLLAFWPRTTRALWAFLVVSQLVAVTFGQLIDLRIIVVPPSMVVVCMVGLGQLAYLGALFVRERRVDRRSPPA